MALDAQIRGRGERNQLLVRRPVRSVTTHAIHIQIPVPLVTNLLPDGMRGMLPPTVTTAAKIIDRGIFHQQGNVGRMRGMAPRALSFFNRFMLREGGILPLDRIAVTCAAYGGHRPLQQGRLR